MSEEEQDQADQGPTPIWRNLENVLREIKAERSSGPPVISIAEILNINLRAEMGAFYLARLSLGRNGSIDAILERAAVIGDHLRQRIMDQPGASKK